jgi:hypothetical protein
MNRSILAVTLLGLTSIAPGACATDAARAMPPPTRACEPPATARARYVDPTVDVTGIDALTDHIGGYLAQFPGTRLEMMGDPVFHHDVLHFAWRVVAGPTTVLEGKDFGRFDAGGRLALIAGFFPTAAAR